MPLTIRAIDHIQVTVPAELEAASIAFYGNVLGLSQVEKPEPLRSRGGAWFQIGDIQIHLSIEADPVNNSSKRHVCYLVEDLSTAQKHFEERGIEIMDESTEPNGLRRFFIRDPAGNKIEIGMRP
jgi:catechol 2,3-dioxygenase-like lactoylglutathione lyase family enzyme